MEEKLIKHATYIIPNTVTTNKFPPKHLPEFFNTILSMTTADKKDVEQRTGLFKLAMIRRKLCRVQCSQFAKLAAL
jgi:hypothetical protein